MKVPHNRNDQSLTLTLHPVAQVAQTAASLYIMKIVNSITATFPRANKNTLFLLLIFKNRKHILRKPVDSRDPLMKLDENVILPSFRKAHPCYISEVKTLNLSLP